MYGIFAYIYHKNQPNVGIYINTIHGSYGYSIMECNKDVYSLKSGLTMCKSPAVFWETYSSPVVGEIVCYTPVV